MAYGDSMSYLPALSRLMGEVESPTQTQGLQQPQFGGSPEQLMAMLQSPQMQQQMHHWGVQFDPSQVRQSPFLPQGFMQAHPHLGGALSGAMANVAATPEAPLVSGAGSGMTRAMQGMMGGPEILRQYQIRQMLSPMQMIGAQIPAQEFQRKQQLLDLLTKMEQDRQQLAAGHQQWQQGQPQRVGTLGMIMPGAQAPPEVAGRSPRELGLGSTPQFNLFPGQGQQQIPAQQDPYFKPFFDPSQLGQRAAAEHPERGATADLKGAQAKEQEGETKAGMPAAKVGAQKAKAEKDRAQAGKAGRGYDPIRAGNAYRQAEKDFAFGKQKAEEKWSRDQQIYAGKTDQASQQALKAAKQAYDSTMSQLQVALSESKSDLDNARGDPGASRRGLVSPGATSRQQGAPPPAPPRPNGVPGNYEFKQGSQGLGWYKPGTN